ncbi:hypothetical protein ACWCQ7_45790 [Streptomyces spinosirectus]
MAAARAFRAREGHLRPARKHIELVNGQEIKPGAFLDNTRRKATRLSRSDALSSTFSACADELAV